MFALVPVKSPDNAKQRLAHVLPPGARKQLTLAMLGDVLDVLRANAGIDRVVLVSADQRVAGVAEEFGATFMDEKGLNCTGLSATVNAAAHLLAAEGITRLMVVHGDLPLLNSNDLSHFTAAHRPGAAPPVTLTPDLRRDGTNLLAWNPTSQFRADYGPGSFARHCDQCRTLGTVPTVCVLPNAGLDVDLAEDYLQLHALRGAVGPRTSVLLSSTDFRPLTRIRATERVNMKSSAAQPSSAVECHHVE